MWTMTNFSVRCLLAAVLVTVISAMPFIGMDTWASKKYDVKEGNNQHPIEGASQDSRNRAQSAKEATFDGQANADEISPDIVGPSLENIFKSSSPGLDRVTAPDSVESIDENDLKTSHREKRFGFGFLPMGFSYRFPLFPRRNRRINSRNYVAMRGKRLGRFGAIDLNGVNFSGQRDGNAVSKRRGFTALRGR